MAKTDNETVPLKSDPATPAEQRRGSDDSAMWELGSAFQRELEQHGVKVETHCEPHQGTEGPDRWTYTLHQTHGPFDSRGEALAWALRNLVTVKAR